MTGFGSRQCRHMWRIMRLTPVAQHNGVGVEASSKVAREERPRTLLAGLEQSCAHHGAGRPTQHVAHSVWLEVEKVAGHNHRLLHVFEFRDGLISREQVWMDLAAVQAQLASAEETSSAL